LLINKTIKQQQVVQQQFKKFQLDEKTNAQLIRALTAKINKQLTPNQSS